MNARRYVAKPVEITAAQWNRDYNALPESWRATGLVERAASDPDNLLVHTNQGPATAYPGDYVIQGAAGELYPVAQLIFRHKYSPLGDES